MKKSILIFCAVIATFSLMAFSYMNWNSEPQTCQKETKKAACNKAPIFDEMMFNQENNQTEIDLLYKVAPRFMATITKEDLHNARSILDVLPEKATKTAVSYSDVLVAILDKNYADDVKEVGINAILNPAQVKLLQNADHSTNIRIETRCMRKDSFLGQLKADNIIYYMTVVPSKEAQYGNEKDELINYLKEKSKDKTVIIEEKHLKPGQVSFTVTKEGTVENVELISTSGYPTVDQSLVEIVRDMPQKWTPATDSKGEKVDQELVFFFGLEGC